MTERTVNGEQCYEVLENVRRTLKHSTGWTNDTTVRISMLLQDAGFDPYGDQPRYVPTPHPVPAEPGRSVEELALDIAENLKLVEDVGIGCRELTTTLGAVAHLLGVLAGDLGR